MCIRDRTMCVEENDFVHLDYNQFYAEHPRLDYQFFKRCLKRLRMEGLIEWERRHKKTYVKVINHDIFKKEKAVVSAYSKRYPEKQNKSFRQLPFFRGFPGVLSAFEDLLRRKREAEEYMSEKAINDLAELIMVKSKQNPQLAKKIINEI